MTEYMNSEQVQSLFDKGFEKIAAGLKGLNAPAADAAPDPPAIKAVNVNLGRPVTPRFGRALKAARRGNWKGAELERDLSQATQALYGSPKDFKDTDDSDGGTTFTIPSSVKAYLNVLQEAAITTEGSAAVKDYAVKALAEGSNTATISGGGTLVPIQFLTDEFVLALTSPIVFANMPEVRTIPVRSSTIELPRESAAASASAYAENATITPNDTTLAMQEFQIKKIARLQLFGNQLFADSDPAVGQVVSEMLGRDLGLQLDAQYIAGAGTGANMTGLRNYSSLTTSSWTAATNGSTPGADDLIKLIFDIYKANANPTAFVMHPRTLQNIVTLKDAVGRYLFSWQAPNLGPVPGPFAYPSAAVGQLNGVPVYQSTQISVAETQGSSNAATYILYGDFRRAVLLERQAVDIFVSQHYAMNADQTAVRATARGQFAALQPKAFGVASGII